VTTVLGTSVPGIITGEVGNNFVGGNVTNVGVYTGETFVVGTVTQIN
jgi:hypothetical protein